MDAIERLRQATPVEFVKAACEAAPVLLARIDELEAQFQAAHAAVTAERQAALAIAVACLDTGLVQQGTAGTVDAVRAVCSHAVRLQATLEAARVAVEKLWTDCRNDCASVQPFLPGRGCDCGAEIAIELRRALHRE